MTPEEKRRRANDFVARALVAAKQSDHPFPEYSVMEAALESRFGQSGLARFNNLFGQKQSRSHPLHYPVVSLPTKEFVDGRLVDATADWLEFPDWVTSFNERIALVKRLAGPHYPYYQQALLATNGPDFVSWVSRNWSTDPNRLHTVMTLYKEFENELTADVIEVKG